MISLSKNIWLILGPINFLIILICIGLCLKLFKKKFSSNFFLILSFIYFCIIAVLPTGYYFLNKLESSFQSKKILESNIDGLLILGGPSSSNLSYIHQQVSFNEAGERLTESIKVIKNFKPKKIIFSGGSPSQTFDSSHAYVAEKFFSEMGIETDNIIFEFKSRNTYENILFSMEIAQPKKEENWLIITSAFHMKRAIYIAEKLDWKFIPYPVDFRTGLLPYTKPSITFLRNINTFDLASHEIIGLISYYFLGRTDKIF